MRAKNGTGDFLYSYLVCDLEVKNEQFFFQKISRNSNTLVKVTKKVLEVVAFKSLHFEKKINQNYLKLESIPAE